MAAKKKKGKAKTRGPELSRRVAKLEQLREWDLDIQRKVLARCERLEDASVVLIGRWGNAEARLGKLEQPSTNAEALATMERAWGAIIARMNKMQERLDALEGGTRTKPLKLEAVKGPRSGSND